MFYKAISTLMLICSFSFNLCAQENEIYLNDHDNYLFRDRANITITNGTDRNTSNQLNKCGGRELYYYFEGGGLEYNPTICPNVSVSGGGGADSDYVDYGVGTDYVVKISRWKNGRSIHITGFSGTLKGPERAKYTLRANDEMMGALIAFYLVNDETGKIIKLGSYAGGDW